MIMIGPGPGTRMMVATRPVGFRMGPDPLWPHSLALSMAAIRIPG